MGKLFVLFDSIVRESGSLSGSAILDVTYGEDSIYTKNEELRGYGMVKNSGAIWVEFRFYRESGSFNVVCTRPDLSEDFEREENK